MKHIYRIIIIILILIILFFGIKIIRTDDEDVNDFDYIKENYNPPYIVPPTPKE